MASATLYVSAMEACTEKCSISYYCFVLLLLFFCCLFFFFVLFFFFLFFFTKALYFTSSVFWAKIRLRKKYDNFRATLYERYSALELYRCITGTTL